MNKTSNGPPVESIASTARGLSRRRRWAGFAFALLLPVATFAAEPTSAAAAAPMTRWEAGKRGLETALPPGRSRAFYREELSRLGYRLRSANEDSPATLEYEVVSSVHRYDVQIDVDQESGTATRVQVAPNLLKARQARNAVDRAQASR